MSLQKRYTVTAALPYANGPLHIGHMAGAYLPSDIFVRYLRANGADVAFVCGSDEHGAAITMRAKKEGISPQQIIDRYHQLNKETFQAFGVSFDIFHRTSSQTHHQLSQDFFTDLYDMGEFVEKETEQYYDEEYAQFLADRYITGTCPHCGYDAAYGDQCEKCGTSLSADDLISPTSVLSGKEPVKRMTRHWFLPLDKYQPWLEEWLLEGKKGKWKSNVYGQCSSWLKAGLQPRAMTRDLDWGVDVPLEGAEGKKLYVWMDAPLGYISATKVWATENDRDWKKYWLEQDDPEDNTTFVAFIGKDNIVFHCIIFPAILHAHGGYVLPQNVPANEFLNLEGKKISTSRDWAVWLHDYLKEFPGKEDVLRYTLTSIMPETKDSEFTWNDFQAKNNNELVAILGNFVNRALVLTNKYYDGGVPERGALSELDKATILAIKAFPARIGSLIEDYHFRDAMSEMMNLARLGNKYLAETEPWKLIKSDPDRVPTIMNISLQVAANLTILMRPFLPFSADRLGAMLSFAETDWTMAGGADLLAPGHSLGKVELLFQKLEDDVILAQMEKLESGNVEKKEEVEKVEIAAATIKDEITFDDFQKMDIRIATILSAEPVPKTDRLLKLTLDTGIDERTVVSGIAGHYSPEDIVGKQVCLLANLAPRKLRGILSHGMILMAEDADGKLRFVSPSEQVAPGSGVS